MPIDYNVLRQNLTKPSVNIRRKFLYNDVDYTDLLVSIDTIRRDMNLSAGTATVTLNNAHGTWNFLHATNTAMGDTAEIQVYVYGDTTNVLTLFKGKVERVRYDGARCILTIRDHAGDFLNKKIGSNQVPVNFYTINYTPDELVWLLLHTRGAYVWGNLDATTSPANTDINYTCFADWRDNHCSTYSYEIESRPTGQTISTLLMKICQTTHSYIWVDNSGKVSFGPPFQPGYTYDDSNAIIDLEIIQDNIVNAVTVGYALNETTGEFVYTTAEATEADSITQFGRYASTLEDRLVWHETQASAEADRDATLTDYAYQQRFFNIKVMNLVGLMEDVGREITVTSAVHGITSATAYVEEINYDLYNWETTIKARWPW